MGEVPKKTGRQYCQWVLTLQAVSANGVFIFLVGLTVNQSYLPLLVSSSTIR